MAKTYQNLLVSHTSHGGVQTRTIFKDHFLVFTSIVLIVYRIIECDDF